MTLYIVLYLPNFKNNYQLQGYLAVYVRVVVVWSQKSKARQCEQEESAFLSLVETKVVNSVPFRLKWPKHSIPIQKMEQNGTNFISF